MFNNQLQIIGNLTKDAEICTPKSGGDKYLAFTVAVYDGKDKPAIFVDVRETLRNGRGDHPLLPYLTKGTKCFVQGKFQPGGYYSEKNQEYVPTTTIWMTACEPLPKSGDAQQPQSAQPAQQAKPQSVIYPNAAPQPAAPASFDETDVLPF